MARARPTFAVLSAVKQGREIITNAAIYSDKLQLFNKKAVIRKVDNDEMKVLIEEPVPGVVYLVDESWGSGHQLSKNPDSNAKCY